MTNDSNFNRVQFRSQMIILRHLADTSTPELAEFMRDQLTETCKFLSRRLRVGKEFIAETKETVVVSTDN